jgi:hypothetical protein
MALSRAPLTILLCALAASGAAGISVAKAAADAALQRDLRAVESKERPVAKVVKLLKDMQAELTASMEDDKKVHELLYCWCKTNNEEKTKAIADGEAKSAQLDAFMNGAAAKIKELKTKRKATQEEMYADQKALDEAEEQRMKDNKAFHTEEVDLLEAIDASEYAIEALSKHHTGFSQVRSVVDRLRKARVDSLLPKASRLHSGDVQVLKSFVNLPADGSASFLSIPGFQSYSPQGGQIFGILEQLKKDFSDSLSDAQKEELKSKTEFEALKAAKLEEIDTAEKEIASIDIQVGDLEEKHAQALEEYEDTQYQVELDTKFLADLTKKCAVSDEEFAARMKARTEEIAGVEDTIAILNSDESFDVAEVTVNKPTVFLQTVSAEGQAQRLRRRQAAAVLRKVADRTGSAQMVMLASSVQNGLDAFTKVKEAIDKMVTELTAQNKDEISMRDWCIENLNTNTRDETAAYDKKTSLEMKIADLKQTIKTLTEDIAASTAAIAEAQKQMKAASEIREGENADYQQTITDQRLMQIILNKALTRIKEVYAPTLYNTEGTRDVGLNEALLQKQPGAAHIATSGTHTDAGNAPARFTTYEAHSGGLKVVKLLEDIIAESKKADDIAMDSEEDAQTAYESFMKSSNAEITAQQTSITNMDIAKAKAEEDLLTAEGDFAATMKLLEDLNALKADLHKSCDYLLKNFDARQAARTAEINALVEAKNILSGMQ